MKHDFDKKKRPLFTPLFTHPGRVIAVEASGNIQIQWKNGEIHHNLIKNYKFIVISEDLYENCDDPDNDDQVIITSDSVFEVFGGFIGFVILFVMISCCLCISCLLFCICGDCACIGGDGGGMIDVSEIGQCTQIPDDLYVGPTSIT